MDPFVHSTVLQGSASRNKNEVIASDIQELVHHVHFHTKTCNVWCGDTKSCITCANSYKIGADTCPCPAWKMVRTQCVAYLQKRSLAFLSVGRVLPPCSTSSLRPHPFDQNRRTQIRTIPAAARNPSLPAAFVPHAHLRSTPPCRRVAAPPMDRSGPRHVARRRLLLPVPLPLSPQPGQIRGDGHASAPTQRQQKQYARHDGGICLDLWHACAGPSRPRPARGALLCTSLRATSSTTGTPRPRRQLHRAAPRFLPRRRILPACACPRRFGSCQLQCVLIFMWFVVQICC